MPKKLACSEVSRRAASSMLSTFCSRTQRASM
jgi:hypothetical protein